MTHHPDQIADLARLRHAEHMSSARQHAIVDVMPAARRQPLAALRRLFVRRTVEPAHVREFRIA